MPVRTVRSTQLPPRQADIIDLVARGMSDKAIAHKLGLSVRTVSNYLTNLYAMLECENRTQLAMLASQPATTVDISVVDGIVAPKSSGSGNQR